MSRDKASLSKGRSYQEIGDYWDEHDLGEVWDSTEPIDFTVDIQSEKRYYAIERALSEKVQEIAKAQGVAPETLVNLWIQEKVRRSTP
ncbi:MAG TPA: CopG family antitoxin [Thermoanaerobaculia bacterium]